MTVVSVHPAGWRRALPWAVALGAVALRLPVLALWAPWQTVPPPAPLRLTADLGADASLATAVGTDADIGTSVVLSPDGALFAFVAQKTGTGTPQLYVRRLDQLQATPLSGTEGAASPFFSPDGQWIAFFAQGKLKKIPVTGGAVVTLCDAATGRGGSWGEDGTIVFTPSVTGSGRLSVACVVGWRDSRNRFRRPATGRSPSAGRRCCPAARRCSTRETPASADTTMRISWCNHCRAGARKIVQRGGYYGRYLPSGHLVYIHDGTLFAAPFDVDATGNDGGNRCPRSKA